MRELHRVASDYHNITVNDEDGVTVLRFDGRRQSSLDAKTGLDAVQPYLDYLHIAVAAAPDAKRALVIGLGGGVLPKRMWHDYPAMTVEVVELDPQVVEIAHEYFGLPRHDPRLRIAVGDGREFLESTTELYDIIVVDAYFEASMPYPFVTREFMAIADSHLNTGGALAYNMVAVLAGSGSRPFQRFAKGISEVFTSVHIFRVGVSAGEGRENIVVVATRGGLTADELVSRVRSRMDGRVSVKGFEAFGDGLYRRDIPLRGVKAFRDCEMPSGSFLIT